MSVFSHKQFNGHEAVHHFVDANTGLHAVIAVHSTALGPAAGGCRYWQYASDDDALTDALRLSRGMTYKNAIAGLPFGGGKAVILAARDKPKSSAMFEVFGRFVDSLGGQYVTAEDLGVSTEDMLAVRHSTKFVSGLPVTGRQTGGDPSPWTALGVYLCMKVAYKAKYGVESLKNSTVAVQGVGNVGYHLCKLLADEGAILTVADVNSRNLERLLSAHPANVVAPDEILRQNVDVLSPCALGGILNSDTIPEIRAGVVAGAANNQLAEDADGRQLVDQGILYSPDYAINSGGIISVANEYLGQTSLKKTKQAVNKIPERFAEILEISCREDKPTNVVADEIAQMIIENRLESRRPDSNVA